MLVNNRRPHFIWESVEPTINNCQFVVRHFNLPKGLEATAIFRATAQPILELKRDHRTPLSEGQKHFAEMLHQCGVPHRVARSYDQAVAALKEWGAL